MPIGQLIRWQRHSNRILMIRCTQKEKNMLMSLADAPSSTQSCEPTMMVVAYRRLQQRSRVIDDDVRHLPCLYYSQRRSSRREEVAIMVAQFFVLQFLRRRRKQRVTSLTLLNTRVFWVAKIVAKIIRTLMLRRFCNPSCTTYRGIGSVIDIMICDHGVYHDSWSYFVIL